MENHYAELKKHYKFTKRDEQTLAEMQNRMTELSETFIDEFYEYIWGFGRTAEFLKNKDIIEHHRTKIQEWYLNLFCGKYDMLYIAKLYRIGEVHVKIGLPTHFVNAAFTFVRTFILKHIKNTCTDNERLIQEMTAVEKIIDINLDVLTSSYREEELSKFLSLSKFEKSTLAKLKKFTSYINFLLALALALVAFFAIGLFLYDIYLLFFSDIGIEKGVLSVLGSLLVLWAAIELIHEEINHLQGKGFAVGAFIMLATAALIRKILIYSLSPEKSTELIILGVVIVSLAVAYRLIEQKQNT